MPYKKSDKLPPSAEKLKGHERDIFVAAANSALKEYEGDEGRAIATGLAAVNSYREKKKNSVKKSIVEAISAFLEKAFPSEEIIKSQEVVDEEMVSYEVVYEPLVKDAHGQWMSLETVEKACEDFNSNLEKGVVQPNLFHLQKSLQGNIYHWFQNNLIFSEDSDGLVCLISLLLSETKWLLLLFVEV